MAVALEDRLNSPVPAVERLDWERALAVYETYHQNDVVPSTLRTRARAWRSFWEFAAQDRDGAPGIRFVDQVTQDRVLRWRAALLAQGRQASTINHAVVALHTVVAKLEKFQLYAGPNGFGKIDQLPEGETVRDILEDGEIETFLGLAQALGTDAYLYVALGVYAGLRLPSEGLGIRWGWIHWPTEAQGGYIRIPKADGRFRVKDREARTIPLSGRLEAILRPHRGAPAAYVLAPHVVDWPADTYRVDLRAAVEGIRHAIPGKSITSYGLRHTFATMCIKRGVPLYKVMRWMGHSSLRMLRRYEHLAPPDTDIDVAFPELGRATGEG